MHGGTTKNAKSAAPTIATLRRGGLLPTASGSPAELRATRAGRRRRPPRRRQRAERWAPVPPTHSPSPRPAIGKKSASTAKREGVAERCADPAVPKPLAVALEWSTAADQMLSALALFLLTTATQHDAQSLSL